MHHRNIIMVPRCLPGGASRPCGNMSDQVERLLGDAEVGHFCNEVFVEENVARFDVSVNDRRILNTNQKITSQQIRGSRLNEVTRVSGDTLVDESDSECEFSGKIKTRGNLRSTYGCLELELTAKE